MSGFSELVRKDRQSYEAAWMRTGKILGWEWGFWAGKVQYLVIFKNLLLIRVLKCLAPLSSPPTKVRGEKMISRTRGCGPVWQEASIRI